VRAAGQWEVRDVPGVTPPLPPDQQDIWIAQDQAARPAISIPPARPLTLVILRPQGGAVGAVDLGVDFTVADVSGYILWLSVASVVLVLLGLVLLFLAIQRLRPGRHAAPKPVRGRHAAGRVPDDTPAVDPAVEEVRDEQPVG
jgi:hypothetical protein